MENIVYPYEKISDEENQNVEFFITQQTELTAEDVEENIQMVFSDQLIYAAQDGSNVIGTGTIDNPYATVSRAMLDCAGALPSKPYYIMVVGAITEASTVQLLPNVSIVGISPSAQIIGNVAQASDWNTASSGSISYLVNLVINNVTFSATPANQPSFKMINVQVNNVLTLNNGNNKVLLAYLYDCILNGAVNVDNAFVYSWSNRFLKPVKIGFSPAFSSVAFFSKSDSYYSGAPVSVTTQGSNVSQLRMVCCEVYSTVSGSVNASIFMDAVSYVAPTLTSGATLTLTTVSNGVNANYTPINYVPTNVSVQGHLQGIDNKFGLGPSGAAGGDLSGTYPNPTVAKINGVTLGSTTATSGNLLIANGTQWVSTALSGDATITGAGVLTIANNAITTPKIANNAVTYAKFQQVNADSLVGNPTGALANATDITLGSTLTFTGSALQTLALSGDVTSPANSFVTTLANNAVTTPKIANNAVTYAKFQQVNADSLVGNPTGALANATDITLGSTLTFTGSALQTLALSGDVTSPANSFVTTLANNAVTTPKIANGAVDLTTKVSGILPIANGGTNLSTYTLGDTLYASAANVLSKLSGNTSTTKQYLSQTGTGVVSAAPAWSAIAGTDVTGAALTSVNDTNITLTLGGTPATALLRAASITAGWTGLLSIARGGNNIGSQTTNGVLFNNGTANTTSSNLTFDGAVLNIGQPTITYSMNLGGAQTISGSAKMSIVGVAAGTGNALPSLGLYFQSDQFPSLQINSFNHANNTCISFDAYTSDGLNWFSSTATSNFQIASVNTNLNINYSSGVSAGNTITWKNGIVLNTSGNVTKPNSSAFSSSAPGTQTFTANTGLIPITLSSTYDKNGNFSNINSRFTAPVSGVYKFSYNVTLETVSGFVAANSIARVYLTINGSSSQIAFFNPFATQSTNASNIVGTKDYQLNAGDTVSMGVEVNAGSNTIGISNFTYLSGYLVG